MKKMRYGIFPVAIALLLTACGGNNSEPAKSSQAPKNNNFTLIDPTDTSMVSSKVKAYVDAMREQEESLDDPYLYDDLKTPDPGYVDVANFLDEGEVEGQNRTVNGAVPDRSDKSLGVNLKFESKLNLEPSEYKVLVADNEDFENAKELVPNDDLEVSAKNLFVNKEYYWKVVAGDEESEVKTFETEDYPRWIDARPLFNVRDMGGYMTDSGKRVKQGLIYRGGEIVTQAWEEHLVTNSETSKKVFREEMKIGVELDLRKTDGRENEQGRYKACAFAEDGDIDFVPLPIGSYGNTISGNKKDLVTIFNLFANADEKPVYYHCYGGADRTGTVGFLLNGLLGVSYTDLVIDYELTSYSSINNEHIRSHAKSRQQWDHYAELISGLKNDKTNGYVWDGTSSMKENIENFLLKACGVSQETINTIRDIMLED